MILFYQATLQVRFASYLVYFAGLQVTMTPNQNYLLVPLSLWIFLVLVNSNLLISTFLSDFLELPSLRPTRIFTVINSQCSKKAMHRNHQDLQAKVNLLPRIRPFILFAVVLALYLCSEKVRRRSHPDLRPVPKHSPTE